MFLSPATCSLFLTATYEPLKSRLKVRRHSAPLGNSARTNPLLLPPPLFLVRPFPSSAARFRSRHDGGAAAGGGRRGRERRKPPGEGGSGERGTPLLQHGGRVAVMGKYCFIDAPVKITFSSVLIDNNLYDF